jgi:hypothetical protein
MAMLVNPSKGSKWIAYNIPINLRDDVLFYGQHYRINIVMCTRNSEGIEWETIQG